MVFITPWLATIPIVAASARYLHLDVERKTVSEPRLARRQSFQASLTQAQQVEYLINITVGTPPQKMAVTLDTGSSDLWVPSSSSQPCRRGQCDGGAFEPSTSSTYRIINEGGFNITYAGPGDSDAGNWVEESLTIGGSSTINDTIMGVALSGSDFHGVMGIGFDTNEAQPNPARQGIYPSVVDNLKSEGLINRKAYSLYLNDLNATTGSVCFGCVDSSKYTGNLTALPLQPGIVGSGPDGSDPASPNAFYVTLSGVSFIDAVGVETQLSSENYAQSVLLDSGTSQTLLTNDVLTGLINGLGGVYVEEQGFAVPCSYSNTNASIRYTFGGINGPSIQVPLSELIYGQILSAQEYPRHSAGACNTGVTGPLDGTIVLGDTFLRSAYVVFDLENYQVAIAQATGGKTAFSSIAVIGTGSSIPGVSSTASASGTQLSGDAATADATGIITVTGKTVTAPSPTFNLGASATASNAQPSSGISEGTAAFVTAAPQAAVLGALGLAGVLMV